MTFCKKVAIVAIKKLRMNYKIILHSLLAVVFTFLIHEFGHWTMGEFLGYEMRMTLNTGYPIAGKYDQAWHYAVISAVGPLITLLQAIIFYYLIKKYSNRNLYPFLFTTFYLVLLSGIVGYRNPNDLGRIGNYLNIGLFTLPIIFIIIHYIMLHQTSKRENYDRKFNVLTLLLIILFSSVWILTNQKFKVILI
jgi:FtsH-binding integral membrane protein